MQKIRGFITMVVLLTLLWQILSIKPLDFYPSYCTAAEIVISFIIMLMFTVYIPWRYVDEDSGAGPCVALVVVWAILVGILGDHPNSFLNTVAFATVKTIFYPTFVVFCIGFCRAVVNNEACLFLRCLFHDILGGEEGRILLVPPSVVMSILGMHFMKKWLVVEQ